MAERCRFVAVELVSILYTCIFKSFYKRVRLTAEEIVISCEYITRWEIAVYLVRDVQ